MTYVGVNRISGLWSDSWQIHATPNIGQKQISFLISLMHQICLWIYIQKHKLCLGECVAVLDQYHLQTTTPSKKEVHNVWSYFSGQYQTYGVNIQAACDHNCCFLFISVAGPGVMGD